MKQLRNFTLALLVLCLCIASVACADGAGETPTTGETAASTATPSATADGATDAPAETGTEGTVPTEGDAPSESAEETPTEGELWVGFRREEI